MSASDDSSTEPDATAIMPTGACESGFSDIHDEWPPSEAFFPSGGSTPLPPSSHPLPSFVSPPKQGRTQGIPDKDPMRVTPPKGPVGHEPPCFAVLGDFTTDSADADIRSSSPRGARHLSETMESMDFAAQLEKLSEKDLESLWAALWRNTHSLEALDHALAGPQTGWNPYRAARSGPRLRMEIMNSQIAEFRSVIPTDSLYISGMPIRRPALTRPPGKDRDAVARRRRAELDELVHGSSAATGGSPGNASSLQDHTTNAAGPSTAVTWTVPPVAGLSLGGTPATIHSSSEALRLREDSVTGGSAAGARVSSLIEEVFASHGRQPEDLIVAHCSAAKLVARPAYQDILQLRQADTPGPTASSQDNSAMAMTSQCGAGEEGCVADTCSSSFLYERLREEVEARVFDALWQRVVVPFYPPPTLRATETVLAEVRRCDVPYTHAVTSMPSPALRPRRVSRRSSTTTKSSQTSSWACESPQDRKVSVQNSTNSPLESSIVLHLRRQSVQEDLTDNSVTLDGAPHGERLSRSSTATATTNRLGVHSGAPITPVPRRHVTYSAAIDYTPDDAVWPAGSRAPHPSSQGRTRPRTGPTAPRKVSPRAATVSELRPAGSRPTRGGGVLSGRTQSSSSQARASTGNASASTGGAGRRVGRANNGHAVAAAEQEGSIHMEDLDDSREGAASGCGGGGGGAKRTDTTAAAGTRKNSQTAMTTASTTLAPLQRAAHQTLVEMGSRRRNLTGSGQQQQQRGKRAPLPAHVVGNTAPMRAAEMSPYLDVDGRDGDATTTTNNTGRTYTTSHKANRRASPKAGAMAAPGPLHLASPKRLAPVGRPTSVGGKPRHGQSAPSPVGSRYGSPFFTPGAGAKRVSPATRRARVSTAQSRPTEAGHASSPPHRERGPQRISDHEPLRDTWDADAQRSVSFLHELPTLDANHTLEAAATSTSETSMHGRPRGVHSASTRAPRTALSERPVTEHGAASQAYRQYARPPVTVRTLEGASRGPSPLAPGKRTRALKPLEQVHHAHS